MTFEIINYYWITIAFSVLGTLIILIFELHMEDIPQRNGAL